MRTIARLVRRLFEAVAVALFGAMVVVFGANITGRFVFNSPIVWADEVLVYLMIWCTFLTICFVTREREHVAFDLAYDMAPPQGRRIMLILGALAVAGVFAAAAPTMIEYIRFLWRERTNILEVRLDVAYSVFGVFIVVLIAQRLVLVGRLMGPGWTAALDDVEGKEDDR